jgi:hypothetical protein
MQWLFMPQGTPFDFTSEHAIGERIGKVPWTLLLGRTASVCEWQAHESTCLCLLVCFR